MRRLRATAFLSEIRRTFVGMTQTSAELSGLAYGVAAGYSHGPKLVEPGVLLGTERARLKWYDIRRESESIPAVSRTEARAFLTDELRSGRLALAGDLGFVILHLCDGPVYLLIVCTWTNNNEMWETVYVKTDGDYALLPRPGVQKETLCVWELGAVWHESQAWSRYLYSARDEPDRLVYLADRFTGEI